MIIRLLRLYTPKRADLSTVSSSSTPSAVVLITCRDKNTIKLSSSASLPPPPPPSSFVRTIKTISYYKDHLSLLLLHQLTRHLSVNSNSSKMGNICNNNGSSGNEPPSSNQPSSTATQTPAKEIDTPPVATTSDTAGPPISSQSVATVEDTVEKIVGKISDFPEGEMHEVDLEGDHKALLVHQNGKLSAVGNKCTHYGAPLIKGYLGDGRVRCPWHGACFNVTSGDIEDFPGLDNLATYDVKVQGEDVVVIANKKDLEKGRCSYVQRCPVDVGTKDKVYVLIGGGPASVECAETLRQEGFDGRIILCSKEQVLPYDRPKLSKALSSSVDQIKLRSESFFTEHKIELQLGKELTKVDSDAKCLTFSDTSTLNYDCLLLATGAKPCTLPVPGFEHVHLLRSVAQANDIATQAKDKRVVVIGTSFIGMEVCSYLSDKASSVDCIGVSAVPYQRVLGARIGKALQKLMEDKGIKFHLSAGVKEIVVTEDDNKVTGVMLPSGEIIPADIVVAGIGVKPATDYLKEFPSPSLTVTSLGEVVVDEHMKAADGIYAAGDIAKFPLPLIQNSISIGHWQIAHNHGRVAGRNMAGKEERFDSIPYFWTVLSGKSLRYCGLALEWDDIIYNGSPEELIFAAYFVKDDKVLAVASLGMDPIVSTSAELMFQNRMPTANQLRENPDLQSLLQKT